MKQSTEARGCVEGAAAVQARFANPDFLMQMQGAQEDTSVVRCTQLYGYDACGASQPRYLWRSCQPNKPEVLDLGTMSTHSQALGRLLRKNMFNWTETLQITKHLSMRYCNGNVIRLIY